MLLRSTGLSTLHALPAEACKGGVVCCNPLRMDERIINNHTPALTFKDKSLYLYFLLFPIAAKSRQKGLATLARSRVKIIVIN